ncbi:MAG: hypothetical protein MZV64_60065 [Ignavibacteriales bacterium]|nr:hypothetical protein [Ignavibacteriales bacterium]
MSRSNCGQVELFERAAQHDRVEVTVTAGVDLDGGSGACRGGTVGVDGGGDIAVHSRDAQPAFEAGQGLFDERGLARTGRGDDVDGEDPCRIDAGAVLLRQTVIGIENIFDYGDVLGHGSPLCHCEEW